jgi:N-acetylglucosaminyl-diphospho-decaprenol L-rhamnosyltransferase
MSPSVGSVLIVTHNSADSIAACLNSLTSCPNWEIIVIDNASQDQTVELVRRQAPKCRIIENSENEGFAAAVNRGVRTAAIDVLLVLNPDCIAHTGALNRLEEIFADSNLGVLGGQLIGSDAQPQRGFVVRRFPTLGGMLAEIFLLNRIWPRNPWNRRYRCLDMDYAKEQQVEQPAGACLAFRREVWERVGGFDETFFPVWFEDVDFCRRIHDAGMKILYSPSIVFTHQGAHSVGQVQYCQRQFYWYRNLQRYFAKHHSRVSVTILRFGIFAGLLFRAALAAVGIKPKCVGTMQAIQTYSRVAWLCAVLGSGTGSQL